MPNTRDDTISVDDFAEVAFSGDYNDLSNKPTSFGWGIDTSKLLVNISGAASFDWTAPEDCIIVALGAGAYTHIYVDGVALYGSSSGSYTVNLPLPLKKGTRINATRTGSYTCTLKAYGIK